MSDDNDYIVGPVNGQRARIVEGVADTFVHYEKLVTENGKQEWKHVAIDSTFSFEDMTLAGMVAAAMIRRDWKKEPPLDRPFSRDHPGPRHFSRLTARIFMEKTALKRHRNAFKDHPWRERKKR